MSEASVNAAGAEELVGDMHSAIPPAASPPATTSPAVRESMTQCSAGRRACVRNCDGRERRPELLSVPLAAHAVGGGPADYSNYQIGDPDRAGDGSFDSIVQEQE